MTCSQWGGDGGLQGLGEVCSHTWTDGGFALPEENRWGCRRALRGTTPGTSRATRRPEGLAVCNKRLVNIVAALPREVHSQVGALSQRVGICGDKCSSKRQHGELQAFLALETFERLCKAPAKTAVDDGLCWRAVPPNYSPPTLSVHLQLLFVSQAKDSGLRQKWQPLCSVPWYTRHSVHPPHIRHANRAMWVPHLCRPR